MQDDKVNKIRISSKFNTTRTKFYNRLEKELREYVSDDVIYSHTYWNENDKLTQDINTVKDSIIDSVIRNKYKTVYKI